MSIRHYNYKRRRRGISTSASWSLWGSLLVAIALQISYPLISGVTLERVTIATVYVGALAMVIHAHLSYGPKYAGNYLLIAFFFGYFIELLGVSTGWPFGSYEYSSTLGPSLLGVPLVVPFAWVMMAHPVLCAARRVTQHWVFLYGGLLLMAWDLFLDPQMVSAGRWTWEVTGSHIPFQPEIPVSNAFGWLLAGMTLMMLLHVLLPRERRKEAASLYAIDTFLGWTLFSGVVGNLFFFSRPGIALFAGFIFTLVLSPYIFQRWLGRP